MTAIRILLVGMAPILREIVRQAALGRDDVDVVGEAQSHHCLREDVAASGANFLLVGIEDADAIGACGAILMERPLTKVLAVEADGRHGFLYELRPQRVPLGELSLEGLFDAIREAACRPPTLDVDIGGSVG